MECPRPGGCVRQAVRALAGTPPVIIDRYVKVATLPFGRLLAHRSIGIGSHIVHAQDGHNVGVNRAGLRIVGRMRR